MKPGDMVFVSHDGKWSRRVPGLVLARWQHTRVLVQFEFIDETLRMMFRRKTRSYAGARRQQRFVWWGGNFKLEDAGYEERLNRKIRYDDRLSIIEAYLEQLK